MKKENHGNLVSHKRRKVEEIVVSNVPSNSNVEFLALQVLLSAILTTILILLGCLLLILLDLGTRLVIVGSPATVQLQ